VARSLIRFVCVSLCAVGLAAFAGCRESVPDSEDPSAPREVGRPAFPVPAVDWNPRQYSAPRAVEPPTIDGHLDDPAWTSAPPSTEFLDIEGPDRPAPHLSTRVRIVWDDDFVYFGAEMEEPHLWATLTERDAVIYHDNDFEVFIDPDGDTYEYYELEINALGTEWDLFLVRPYRDGGPALNAWDIQGLHTAVSVDGTLNDPTDMDRGWSVEIAIPWSVLREAAHGPAPPEIGDVWRVNFSRVQWQLDVTERGYSKRTDDEGEPLPEANWVWSPQGLIAMHYPEMWGFVRFVDGDADGTFVVSDVERAKWALRTVYYAQREHFGQFGRYSEELADVVDGWPADLPAPEMQASADGFQAAVGLSDGTRIVISTGGRTQVRRP